jgi:hypothetical protein
MSEATEHGTHAGQDFEKVARGLTAVGLSWAHHGLTIGKSALETSARTLRETAEILGQLSEKFRAGAAEDCAGCAEPRPPADGGRSQDVRA